jgi:hypothetical protein
MLTYLRAALLCAIAVCFARPAAAQNEAALKSYFEGRRVTVRIDMPGTSDGVNVFADGKRPLDFGAYKDDLKKYGAAIRTGQSSMVTLVKVKKDLIEFQLDGGGYGTFGDDTSTTVYMPNVEKSARERELEQRVREEEDRDRRRRLEQELDELRDARERENRRIAMERDRAEALKAERLAERRLAGGSRFNIRYQDHVPAGTRPDDVLAALTEYVDFQVTDHAVSTDNDRPSTPFQLPQLRKGMTRGDVEQMLGRPAETSQHTSGDVAVTTLVFVVGDDRVSADFVEEVLVRFAITSK